MAASTDAGVLGAQVARELRPAPSNVLDKYSSDGRSGRLGTVVLQHRRASAQARIAAAVSATDSSASKRRHLWLVLSIKTGPVRETLATMAATWPEERVPSDQAASVTGSWPRRRATVASGKRRAGSVARGPPART